MSDQAEGLRRLLAELPAEPAARAPGGEVFAIGSGKGGVGKSVLSILLAGALARTGRRVLLLDGAQAQGNLHILLGVRPRVGLEALLAGEVAPRDLVSPVAERLWLVPAESGGERVYGLAPVDRARLHHRLTALYDGFDSVVVDSGPGIESVVRATMGATMLAVVAVPEPAALSDAYALVKIVHLQVPTLPVGIVANRVQDASEAAAVFDRLAIAARRFLRKDLGLLGAFAEDPALGRVVRQAGGLLDHLRPEADEAAAHLIQSAATAAATCMEHARRA